jgi:hypothetical protein
LRLEKCILNIKGVHFFICIKDNLKEIIAEMIDDIKKENGKDLNLIGDII